jgi:hypothetical protein
MGLYMKTLWGIFVIIIGAGRGGSSKIRNRPAPGIGAIFVTRNRPVTSTGREYPHGSGRVGPGRVGAVWNCHPYC